MNILASCVFFFFFPELKCIEVLGPIAKKDTGVAFRMESLHWLSALEANMLLAHTPAIWLTALAEV